MDLGKEYGWSWKFQYLPRVMTAADGESPAESPDDKNLAAPDNDVEEGAGGLAAARSLEEHQHSIPETDGWADNQQDECVPVDPLDSVQLPCNDAAAPSEDIKDGFEPSSPCHQSFSSSSVQSSPKKGSPHEKEPKEEASCVGSGNTKPALESDGEFMKSVDTIVLRQNHMKPLFFSPYPLELAGMCIYLCDFCLLASKSRAVLRQHLMMCLYRSPPGNKIYHKGRHSIFEVDGKKDKWYAENLCLLARCFLKNKALCYDIDCDIDWSVEPSYDLQWYLFYVLTENDWRGCHVVGYFSKEKSPIEHHNLAYILVLPPYQRRGFGRLLVEFSYELSKHEGTIGTPERPLSLQGLLLYQSYWRETILDALVKWWETFEKKEEAQLSVSQISHITSIKKEDVTETLCYLGLFICDEGEHGIPIPDNVVAMHLNAVVKERLRVDPECIEWKPDEVARACM